MIRAVARRLAEVLGGLVMLAGLAVLFEAILMLRAHDYVAALLLGLVAVPLVRAAVDLLRPSLGE